MAMQSMCLSITPLFPPRSVSSLGTRQSPWTCVTSCSFPGLGAGLVNGRAGKGREREKIRELGLDELERERWAGQD